MQQLCLWSGPRNVSTALMYSFAQRADTVVEDEPLYGHYLRVSGADHPGRDEVLADMNCDGNAVMAELLARTYPDAIRLQFMKQMAHHLLGIDRELVSRCTNVFLIRDPREMLPSLTKQLPEARLRDTALDTQWDLFEHLQRRGENPPVIDSRLLLVNPPAVLEALCNRIGIDFDASMLRWPAGPRPEDGIWAKHWYHAVHKSTGFAPYRPKTGFPDRLTDLLDECRPFYDRLYEHAICREESPS